MALLFPRPASFQQTCAEVSTRDAVTLPTKWGLWASTGPLRPRTRVVAARATTKDIEPPEHRVNRNTRTVYTMRLRQKVTAYPPTGERPGTYCGPPYAQGGHPTALRSCLDTGGGGERWPAAGRAAFRRHRSTRSHDRGDRRRQKRES